MKGLPRIYLSPPHLGSDELRLVQEAFSSNWIAPLGPHVDAFESEFAAAAGARHAAALSSGTAALHLAMKQLGVRPRRRGLLLDADLRGHRQPHRLPGRHARSSSIPTRPPGTWTPRCWPRSWTPPSGAAGGRARSWWSTSTARARTSIAHPGRLRPPRRAVGGGRGGGAGRTLPRPHARGRSAASGPSRSTGTRSSRLPAAVCWSRRTPRRSSSVRFLASQAREPAPHYEHKDVGFNYRLSNVLAAIGRGQLHVLRERVAARRRTFSFYRERAGRRAGHLLHAGGALRPGLALAHRHPGRPRRVRRLGGGHPAPPRGGRHRIASGVEADAPAAGVRAAAGRRAARWPSASSAWACACPAAPPSRTRSAPAWWRRCWGHRARASGAAGWPCRRRSRPRSAGAHRDGFRQAAPGGGAAPHRRAAGPQLPRHGGLAARRFGCGLRGTRRRARGRHRRHPERSGRGAGGRQPALPVRDVPHRHRARRAPEGRRPPGAGRRHASGAERRRRALPHLRDPGRQERDDLGVGPWWAAAPARPSGVWASWPATRRTC